MTMIADRRGRVKRGGARTGTWVQGRNRLAGGLAVVKWLPLVDKDPDIPGTMKHRRLPRAPRPLILCCLVLAPLCGRAGEAALRFSGGQTLLAPPVPVGPHTIELWMRQEGDLSLGNRAMVLLDWGGRVGLRNSLGGLDYLVDLGGSSPAHATISPISPGEWHHVAASYDGAVLRLIVDGTPAAARNATGSIAGDAQLPVSLGAPLVAGRGVSSYVGLIDDVRIWSSVRSEQEVYDALHDHLAGNEPGLTAYFDLDEGAGPTAADIAGGRTAVLGDGAGADARDPAWAAETAPVRKADPGIALGFDPPGPLALTAGEPFEVACTLTASRGAAPSGISGWTIAVRHERTRFILDDAFTLGTAADLRAADGFVSVERVDDGVTAGFISRAVISVSGSKMLPVDGVLRVARARYRGVLGADATGEGSLHYDERLPSASFGPAANIAVTGGVEKKPSKGRLALSLQAPSFGFAFDPPDVTLATGRELEVAATVTTEGNRALSGISAWSISVAHDRNVLDLLEVTTAGTSLDAFRAQDIFLLTEQVSNETGNGYISVAILNLKGALSLPANGTAVIARARYKVRDDAKPNARTRVLFADGLRGSGVPITCQVNFIGGNPPPDRQPFLVRVVPDVLFLRGNVNGDARINLADGIFILNKLYKGGPDPMCLEAADVNDDGKVNISDAIYLLSWLFKKGPKPTEPFSEVGADPTPDGLGCEQYP